MAGKSEPRLTDAARAFVVQQLAMWDAPSVVAAAVRQEFGVTISPQAVEFYDPTKRAGQKLHERWKTLFHETRQTFLDSSAEIGVTHRVVRLRTLQRLIERAEKQGNVALVAQLLKQVAEEVGEVYTNKRELAGKGGGPVQIVVQGVDADL